MLAAEILSRYSNTSNAHLCLACISAVPGDPAVQLLHLPMDRVLLNGYKTEEVGTL